MTAMSGPTEAPDSVGARQSNIKVEIQMNNGKKVAFVVGDLVDYSIRNHAYKDKIHRFYNDGVIFQLESGYIGLVSQLVRSGDKVLWNCDHT